MDNETFQNRVFDNFDYIRDELKLLHECDHRIENKMNEHLTAVRTEARLEAKKHIWKEKYFYMIIAGIGTGFGLFELLSSI